MALVVALSGCDSQVPGPPLVDPAALPSAEINPVERGQLADGGTLRWGINELPAQWNPHHPAGNLSTVSTVLRGLLPAPFHIDETGRAHPDPDYVTDVQVVTDPTQVVTLTLEPRARWSTGAPITWRDYAAMVDALSGSDPDYQVLGEVGYSRIADVRAGADDHEVVITFDEPFADYAALFQNLLPADYSADPEAFNSGYLDRIPVTAGPFALDAIDPSAQTVTLARDDSWWGEPAKLDRIVFRSLSPDALDAAFLDGGIDVYAVAVDAASYQRVKTASGGEVRAALAPDYRHITLNGQSPALSDVDVRHAVFLGIDREAIANSAFSAIDWPSSVLGNHFLAPNQKGYVDNSGKWGTYDPERAAELLDGAGWRAPEPGAVRTRQGQSLTLRFLVPQGFAPAQNEAELVQAMLAEIGIEVRIEAVPGDQLFGGYVLPGDYDMVAFVNSGGGFPASEFLYQWSNAVTTPDGQDKWGSNVARIGSPEIDGALAGALEELEPDAALRRLNEADRLLWEAGHTLPLYQRPELVATRTDLANVGASGFGGLDYADIGYTTDDGASAGAP
ncbi:ABC transporter family substrate-binding protein [Nocardiopsis ansamitocini]|uniref:ABC transporter substrate-binding protein n=1 Tax=Nocardiopsis ansamitocini TaxID=1670832 RepID=A0A9W6P346_9ACTN|nr:ABC transporter family substrate-binding protein [Nocardiopsis ansamitocini]GLU46394.1 ABC transporter substrate-binding protein [Nocardiopsis ansamitocini]